MNRAFAAVLAFLFLLPAASAGGNDGGNHLTSGRAAPDHNGSLTISNFSACQLNNVALGPGGGPARLQRSDGYYAKMEFPIVTTAADIDGIHLAANSRGEYIAAWREFQPPLALSLHIQRFDSEGAMLGGQTVIGPSNVLYSSPSIAVNSKDEIILVWCDNSTGGVGTDYRLYFQRYDSYGMPIGGKVRVSTADFIQEQCTVCVGKDDNFLVAWNDYSTGNSVMRAQWFDPSGNKIKGTISVSDTPFHNLLPKIAIAPDGSFGVVWTNYFSDPYYSYFNAYAQFFDSGSNKLGGNVPLYINNTTTAIFPRIAAFPQGGFLVTFTALDSSYMQNDTFLRFDSSGNRIPAQSFDMPNAACPSPAIRPSGEYLLAYGDLTVSPAVLAVRMFARDGTQKGGPVTVVSGSQYKDVPLLAPAPDDAFMVMWLDGRDSKTNLYARFFYHPFLPSGSLITDTNAPDDLFSWSSAEMAASLNSSKSYLGLSLSADNGTTWQPLPSNGSLASAGHSPAIRIKADFSTTDNSTSPALEHLNLSFVADHLPLIGEHANLSGWKKQPQTIQALASDADGDSLTYNWSQTGGPGVTLIDTVSPSLNFTPDKSGDHVFRLVVGDGLGQSAPALIHFLVLNRPPVASLNSSATTAFAGVPLLFNASGSSGVDDNITHYNFRFGDGNESGWGANPVVSHAYAAAGYFTANVSVRDEEGNESTSPPVIISVTLNNVPRLTVSVPKEGQTVNTTSLAVAFTVDNFPITQAGGHVHYQLDGQGEVMWFSTASFTLTNLTDGKHLLKVYLADANHTRLTNPEAYVQVNFTVQLPPMPDLAVTSTDVKVKPESPKEGDAVTITVTIYNVGQVDAGAFTVRFLVDDAPLPDQTVLTLGKGANIVREAKWKAAAGSHTIKVVIDPAGSINEAAKANNEASVKVSVAKKPAPAAEFPWMLIGVALLLVVVIAVLVAFMLMRRGKPAAVMQSQATPASAQVQSPPPYQAPQQQPPMQPRQDPPLPPFNPPQQPPPVPPPT